MMILLKKRTVQTLAFSACMILGMASVLWAGAFAPVQPASGVLQRSPVIWVIDPGHGGEDGGAVSADGIVESHINLEVSLKLRDLLRLTGQQTRMIRTDDRSVCDEGLDTIRARKASDIRNRVSLVNETEGAVLLSIHQNSLPSSPVTHGAQVFWNPQEGGEPLAEAVQDTLNLTINPGNEKLCKKIPQTIYLMNHVTAPAILVECGFLSNGAETRQLSDPTHQTKLALAITAGCLRALAGEELS